MRQRAELLMKSRHRSIWFFRELAGPKPSWPEVYEQTASDFIEEKVARLYQMYRSKLVSANAFDFDDLLMRVVEIFREFPRVLEKYQTQLQYIMVDSIRIPTGPNTNYLVCSRKSTGIYLWWVTVISPLWVARCRCSQYSGL